MNLLTYTASFNVLLLAVVTGEWISEMENSMLYEGDIVLSPEELANIRNGTFAFASTTSDLYWPKGVAIPYEIASSIDGHGLQAIKDAIADYQKYTCLRFKPRARESQYLYFYRGAGCSSPVGRKYRNDISLGRNCWKKGIVMHEMAHSLGMFHEQSRPDRDNYIKILWENIQGDEKVNFQKEPSNTINSHGTAYDLKSMMHYPSNAFGGGKMTIKVLDSSKQDVIGQRDGFSEIDKQQLNLMYKCGSITPPSKVTTTQAPPVGNCMNNHSNCNNWANQGYCTKDNSKDYMSRTCCHACKVNCVNKHANCDTWSNKGECKKNPGYMLKNCMKSCKVC